MAYLSPRDSFLLDITKDLTPYVHILVYSLAHLTADKTRKRKKNPESHRWTQK